MSRIGEPTWKSVYEKTVEKKFAETHWPVYEAEAYQLCGIEGFRYVRARKPGTEIEKFVDPLSPEYAGLFLEFARWFDTQKMEKIKSEHRDISTLDTERNAQSTLAWVRRYGVLGLGTNPGESFAVGGGIHSSSTQIAAERLNALRLGHSGTRAYRKSPTGGKHETVEEFVLEAYEANIVLKMYEAATSSPVDVPYITRFMSDRRDHDIYLPLVPEEYRTRRSVQTERELWSQDPESAQQWALMVVEETVSRKLNDVYPILVGEPGAYEEGWGFKSLLGGVWLQMRNFMRGENNRCLQCSRLFPKRRRDQVYCDETCGRRYRAARSYAKRKQRQERWKGLKMAFPKQDRTDQAEQLALLSPKEMAELRCTVSSPSVARKTAHSGARRGHKPRRGPRYGPVQDELPFS